MCKQLFILPAAVHIEVHRFNVLDICTGYLLTLFTHTFSYLLIPSYLPNKISATLGLESQWFFF